MIPTKAGRGYHHNGLIKGFKVNELSSQGLAVTSRSCYYLSCSGDDLINSKHHLKGQPMPTQTPILTIGIVAGEASGDALGADFMAQMNNLTNGIEWVGVGGSKMEALGLTSLFPLERLAVMGLVEVVKHLPDLLNARKELLSAFEQANIDLFIGIDAPDFNLRVAKKLKPQGIFCVQYVSPSVWAWRENRIHGIKRATDLVLCLFPFELDVYAKHQHPAICVGHPLLSTLPAHLLTTSTIELRTELIWDNALLRDFFGEREAEISQLICVMPGSRRGEINANMPRLLDAIEQLILVDSELCFVIPTLDANQHYIVQEWVNGRSETLQTSVAVTFSDSHNDTKTHDNFSQAVMAMCDVIVLASGTATLEAMLLNKPMVVIYHLNNLTYAIAKRLVKVPYVALPNILAGEQIVPELIQDEATGDNICREVTKLLQVRGAEEQREKLAQTTQVLRQQSAMRASDAVLGEFILH